jgi:hypothetical protein
MSQTTFAPSDISRDIQCLVLCTLNKVVEKTPKEQELEETIDIYMQTRDRLKRRRNGSQGPFPKSESYQGDLQFSCALRRRM